MADEDFEVRNARAEAKLKQIGNALAESMEGLPGYGFTLLLFKFNTNPDVKGEMFYISNADRDSMIAVLKEYQKILATHKMLAYEQSIPEDNAKTDSVS
jgi:hypothetical protein